MDWPSLHESTTERAANISKRGPREREYIPGKKLRCYMEGDRENDDFYLKLA